MSYKEYDAKSLAIKFSFDENGDGMIGVQSKVNFGGQKQGCSTEEETKLFCNKESFNELKSFMAKLQELSIQIEEMAIDRKNNK